MTEKAETLQPSQATGPAYILVDAIQKLSLARSIEEVMGIVKVNARKLTQADGATFILREGDKCYYVDEDSATPLWKGNRFSMSSCVSGWVMSQRTPAVIDDVADDSRVPGELYKSTYVKSMCMVPIRVSDPIGAIGNYWSHHQEIDREQLEYLQTLANATAVAIENIHLMNTLEQRVEKRTRELAAANQKLAIEIAQKQRAEEEVRRLSLEDYMTGLYNRRGFFHIAEEAFKLAKRKHYTSALLYADINGLKQCNDHYGHDAGDELIIKCAQVVAEAFRDADVVARIGGDEFAVFATDVKKPEAMKERLEAAIDKANESKSMAIPISMSIGLIINRPDEEGSLQQLIKAADNAMYEHKRALSRLLRPSA